MTDRIEQSESYSRLALVGREENTTVREPEEASNRIALLVGGGNKARLADHLKHEYKMVEPVLGILAPDSFDMAIVDIEGLRRFREQLIDAKVREEPTFLPIILVLSDRELRHRFKKFWDTVDEFIISPVDPREFDERISLLLRTRRLALAQRDRLAYLVNHDRVTGLPSQNLFGEHIVESVREASLLGKKLHIAVIRISLTQVMQSLGHQGLERVAVQCSMRLANLVNNQAYLARLTTEEWGLAFRSDDTMAKLLEVCKNLTKLADEPIEVNGERVHLTLRIGVGTYPDDASDASTALDCAMAALSESKNSEPVFYSRNVQHSALRFMRTHAGLFEAIEKEQFELWYQPQLDFVTGNLIGVEALVRWRLPNGQLVPPGDFMAVAEATGQILAIDRWVLEKACSTMRAWEKESLGIRRVSVNVTAKEIESNEFVNIIRDALKRNELPPPSLELELTETALLDTSEGNLKKLDELRSHGVSIAIDDFGTGYSSLGYLHKLPITTLKIDKAFVDHIADSATDEAIAETIVWLARKFGLETVAEGIETEDQAKILAAMGVTTAQGYLYGRPMPEADLKQWIKSRG